ncbi:MAG: MYG1 family protein [Chlamydiales bacterium]|nr:MYG1 family protein [Chlamydiales bacterium]
MPALRSVGTHDGSFHADEVTACALLILFGLVDRDKVVRTRSEELLAQCEYVCDVGGIYDPAKKRFDHHQISYKGDMSSAGMVLLYLKDSGKIDSATYDFFNRSLILGVDAHDTGRSSTPVGTATFSIVIANFVPPTYEAEEAIQNEAFNQALEFVLGHLKRLLERYRYILACRKLVEESMAASLPYLFFEKPIPWLESFFELGGERHPALFVIMPSSEGWKLRAIPPNSEERMKLRRALPEPWGGLRDQELERVSGIDGAVFCHKGRFISIWKTKEAVFKALEKSLKT